MGLALRQLPDQWQEKHGYRPLLAETFTDLESFEGTCYKASNWQPCGLTKGFAPTHRADFLPPAQTPQKTLAQNPLAKHQGQPLRHGPTRRCTPEYDLRLSRYFGTSPVFWPRLQLDSELMPAERENGERISREVQPHAT